MAYKALLENIISLSIDVQKKEKRLVVNVAPVTEASWLHW